LKVSAPLRGRAFFGAFRFAHVFNSTIYVTLSGNYSSGTEAFTQTVIPACVFERMLVWVPAGGNTINGATVVMLRIEDDDTDLSVTIPNTAVGVFTDDAQVSVVDLSVADIRIVSGGTTGAITLFPCLQYKVL